MAERNLGVNPTPNRKTFLLRELKRCQDSVERSRLIPVFQERAREGFNLLDGQCRALRRIVNLRLGERLPLLIEVDSHLFVHHVAPPMCLLSGPPTSSSTALPAASSSCSSSVSCDRVAMY